MKYIYLEVIAAVTALYAFWGLFNYPAGLAAFAVVVCLTHELACRAMQEEEDEQDEQAFKRVLDQSLRYNQ